MGTGTWDNLGLLGFSLGFGVGTWGPGHGDNLGFLGFRDNGDNLGLLGFYLGFGGHGTGTWGQFRVIGFLFTVWGGDILKTGWHAQDQHTLQGDALLFRPAHQTGLRRCCQPALAFQSLAHDLQLLHCAPGLLAVRAT